MELQMDQGENNLLGVRFIVFRIRKSASLLSLTLYSFVNHHISPTYP